MMKKFGVFPFWFWNDNLNAEELRRQIAEMNSQGINGFFIHPRQGLKQPYLSQSYFDLVSVAVEEAEKYGMDVHIYDEYPYPSGIAGGEVALGRPEFQATTLKHQAFKVQAGRVRLELLSGYVLNCSAFPLIQDNPDWGNAVSLMNHVGMVLKDESFNETGLTRYNRKRYFASNPTPVLEVVLEQPALISVSVQQQEENHKFWGKYVDVLNPEAIQTFIQLTHERYAKHVGDHFGTSIFSMFVDEIQPKWSSLLPPRFKKEYGYDLLEAMPALALDSHPNHTDALRDFESVKYQMFVESFEKPIAEWCRQHRLLYSGEKPSLRLQQLNHMDMPGCDPGHTKAGAALDVLRPLIRQNARAVVSTAYFHDKPTALCECFHSLGWSGTLQDARLISDGLLLMGIPFLVPHGFFYSTHALKKHDAPPTFFFQLPYWKLFHKLTERVKRLATLFEGTWIDAAVLVVDPTSGSPSQDQLIIYETLLNTLMEEHIDFLIVDSDILSSGTPADERLTIKDVTVDTVIVPPSLFVEDELAHELDRLNQYGINLLHVTDTDTKENIANLLRTSCHSCFPNSPSNVDCKGVWSVNRTDGERHLRFFVNTTSKSVDLLFEEDTFEEIPLDFDVPTSLERTDSVLRRTVNPFEAFLVKRSTRVWKNRMRSGTTLSLKIPDTVIVKPLHKNGLRLGDFELSLDQGETSKLVPAIPLANQLEKGGFAFPPFISFRFGGMPSLDWPDLDLLYRRTFVNNCSQPVELVMEPGSIVGEWTLVINEDKPLSQDDFQPTETHVKGSLGVDVTSWLTQGDNSIVLNVKTNQADGGLINPLYLFGDFGVAIESGALEERPTRGPFENYENNKLPYYSGSIDYEFDWELSERPSTAEVRLALKTPNDFQESCEIRVNDSQWKAACWSPYHVTLPTERLSEGVNKVVIRVHTSLIRSFEGEFFNVNEHRNESVARGTRGETRSEF